jgi:hypothetical protein
MPVFIQGERQLHLDDETPKDQLDRAQKWVDKVPGDVYSQCVTLLNRLEAWSMYFTSKLADEDLAFVSCGPIFVTMVLQLYPVLVVARTPRSAGKYPHTLRLLTSWLAAMEERELGLKEGHLQRQLAEIQNRDRAKGARIGKPLGTADVDFE